MALSLELIQKEELHICCPWCMFDMYCPVMLGQNNFICSSCGEPFKIKVTLEKDYANRKKENKTK